MTSINFVSGEFPIHSSRHIRFIYNNEMKFTMTETMARVRPPPVGLCAFDFCLILGIRHNLGSKKATSQLMSYPRPPYFLPHDNAVLEW